jgi:hypothetical protein
MTTFDGLLPAVAAILKSHLPGLEPYLPILVNRDLNGRIRLVVEAAHKPADVATAKHPLHQLAAEIHAKLGPHTVGLDQVLLFEDGLSELIDASNTFDLLDREGNTISNIHVADRLAQEATWETISDPGNVSRVPRVVFYSIKGGVGRSTALAACAWSLAASGQRVLVLDLDLESPGLSTSLLPQSRQPAYGITDWLVEDLVGNGHAVFDQMHSSISTPQRGELIVVPSHGFEPGEYVSKLGRVWMPGFTAEGYRQNWSERLRGLISALEQTHQPSIVMIDSRAGIDEVASACVTDLAARRIYLFAVDSLQTWQGYRMLFDHWRLHGVAPDIREWLQVVGALIPTWSDGALTQATQQLRENAYFLFSSCLYDEAWPDSDEDADCFSSPPADLFNFDLPDRTAPHSPFAIGWNQAFAAIESLHDRLLGMEADQIRLVFGSLLADLQATIGEIQ